VRLVIADTGPVNYLVQIGQIELLPRLFDRIALPAAVQAELSDPRAPLVVQRWIAAPPAWLEIHKVSGILQLATLDLGEAAAIALALSLHADLLLMDERAGVFEARKQGLHVTGTLGLLDLAAEQGMIDFAEAIGRLEQTTFRRPAAFLRALLKKHEERG